jgi:DNA-binding transcriptional regulator YdaS (Cro superfamily)
MVGVRATASPAVISGNASGPRAAASKNASAGEPVTKGQALVAVAPVVRPELPAPVVRRVTSAAFLAQLIATREQFPQTRERRRAEPADAITLYAATLAATPAPFAPVMSRML